MIQFKRPSPRTLIRALIKARKILADGNETYFCYTMSRVGSENPALFQATCYLKRYVHKQLGKHTYLDDWQSATKVRREALYKKHGVVYHRFLPHSERQKARIQWIDWMLAGLREEVRNG